MLAGDIIDAKEGNDGADGAHR